MRPLYAILSQNVRVLAEVGKNIYIKRPSFAKRLRTVKKVLYIFFDNKGICMQITGPKGKTVTGNFFTNAVIKNSRNIKKVVTPKQE